MKLPEHKDTQLNKYIAQTGLCSRRKAEDFIKAGDITVNNKIVKDAGYRVTEADIVKYKNQLIEPEEKVYILLNKPKGHISTVSDEKNRKTILDLIDSQINKRVFPIGRLDRATTGLILLTNDGEFSQKLAHPSFNIEKVYVATLDFALKQTDFNKIKDGLKLEDGFIKPDYMQYLEKRNIIKVVLHSGKNRIVRRIFEHLGYKVKKLDRTNYAGLTKKHLPQGSWRFLSNKEINQILDSANYKKSQK